jgi:glycerophosphoryl diester phosphodiesterase
MTPAWPKLPWALGPVAHRGLHDAARGVIENTHSAIQAALDGGYAIEVDLQAASDGQPVVFHDEELDRLMKARGLVAAHGVAELRGMAYRDTDDRILTLDELLEIVAGRVPLYIEVKTLFGTPGQFERNIAARLAIYAGPAALMSFDPACLIALKTLAPQVPRGVISYHWDDGWMPALHETERKAMRELTQAPAIAPSFIAYDIDDLPEPAPLALRSRCPLLTWTVRTEAQRAKAAQYADAIIFEGFAA